MYVSTLGAQQTTTLTTTTTSTPIYGHGRAIAPVYYSPGMFFTRRLATGSPGQLYNLQINPAEIEKAVYKDLPQSTKKEQEIIGTEPQKVIVLRSGLEIPAYIMQRDLARKQAEVREREIASILPPLPKFHKIGLFASKKPAQASLLAIGLGYICGQVVYSFKH